MGVVGLRDAPPVSGAVGEDIALGHGDPLGVARQYRGRQHSRETAAHDDRV